MKTKSFSQKNIAGAGSSPALPRAGVWDPASEIARLKDGGLINIDHQPGQPVNWGELATLINRLRQVDNSGPRPGAVNVPVAVLWSEPGPKRDHDNLILGAATEPAAWARGMDPEMRLWLVGRAETQALYGERLATLEAKGDWLKVAALSQKTRQNELGYPGWVPAAQVSFDSAYLKEQPALPEVVVAAPLAGLYRDAALSEQICNLCYQTRLPLLAEEGQAYRVRLPGDSTGYLGRSGTKKAGELTYSGAAAAEEARRFLGLNYIWAGTSSYGFDCSGFTFRVLQSQGLSVPRDADEQAEGGTPVKKEDLLPGDLLFFANENGKGDIHHVGIYAGRGLMVHAPNSKSFVRVEAFDTGSYAMEYWGARRYGS